MTLSRRGFAARTAGLSALFWTRTGAFAESLEQTAAMTEGPFYPDRLPLDTDNDLIVVNDATTPAVGEITYLSGRVLGRSGNPVRNAHVEIWQCDADGIYNHTRDSRHRQRDQNFQSYGRFITDREGRYFFRTIKPVRYTGRTPHIHVAVSQNGHRVLTSQILIQGHKGNRKDRLFMNIPEDRRDTVLADFRKVPDSPIATWETEFNLVLGKTADDSEVAKG